MGFWGSLWNGIKSIGRAAYKNVITPAVKAVSYVVTPIVKTVAKIAQPIINVAKRVCEKVSQVIQKGKQFISKGINYFFEKTWLGKKIKQGYNYVMNDTFIGKAISKVGSFISKTSDAFFKDTWIGQKLSSAKRWFDNTALGSFVNSVAPIVGVAGTILGGVGGFIGSAINTASKIINVVRNPTELLNIPIVSNTINKVTQSRIYRTCNSFYNKGKQFYQNNIKPFTNKINNLTREFVSKTINSRGFKFIQGYIQKKSPLFVYKSIKNITNGAQYIKKKINQFAQPYIQNFKRTSFGNKTVKTANFVVKYVVSPVKFIGSQTLGRTMSYFTKKIKDTNTYKKCITENINKFNNIYTKGFMQSKNVANKLQLPQLKLNGVDSEPMMASYIQKYGSSSLQKGLDKTVEKFKPISLQKKRDNPSLNEILADSSKVLFKSVQFTSGQPQEKGYSIEGRLILENKSQEKVKFQIDSGQLFGCSKQKTSQHVVVRKLVGQLQPKQEKQFTLQGFCADVNLKWPHGDKNYSLTSYFLDEFKDDMSQTQVWSKTN